MKTTGRSALDRILLVLEAFNNSIIKNEKIAITSLIKQFGANNELSSVLKKRNFIRKNSVGSYCWSNYSGKIDEEQMKFYAKVSLDDCNEIARKRLKNRVSKKQNSQKIDNKRDQIKIGNGLLPLKEKQQEGFVFYPVNILLQLEDISSIDKKIVFIHKGAKIFDISKINFCKKNIDSKETLLIRGFQLFFHVEEKRFEQKIVFEYSLPIAKLYLIRKENIDKNIVFEIQNLTT